MVKQKAVLRVSMEDAKKRKKALKTAVGLPGVISAAVEGDRIVVIGEGIDPITLAVKLRKQMGFAELVSVAAVEEKKEEKKDKAEEGAKNTVQPVLWPYQYTMAQPYIYETQPYQDPGCNIM